MFEVKASSFIASMLKSDVFAKIVGDPLLIR